MTNESYGKCRTCRFCDHAGEDWVCCLKLTVTNKNGSCDRYRPGCCENCSKLTVIDGQYACAISKVETDVLNVCSDYDPNAAPSVRA